MLPADFFLLDNSERNQQIVTKCNALSFCYAAQTIMTIIRIYADYRQLSQLYLTLILHPKSKGLIHNTESINYLHED